MFKAVLGLLTGWKGYAVAMLVGAISAGAAAWAAQAWRYEAQLANLQAAHATVLEKQAQAVVASVEAARDLEKRRTAAMEKERDKAQKAARSAHADATAARSNALGLRKRVDQILADARSRDPALANRGPSAGSALDLLAYMLGQSIERNIALAEYADKARIAGLTCERPYSVLRSSAR